MNLRKQKWLISCSYNANKSMIGQHVAALSKSLNLHSSTYEDFNAGMEHVALKNFCNLYSLTSLIKKPTCWKNPSKPSCIDLILTSCPKYLQNCHVIETGLSDFHKLVVIKMQAENYMLQKTNIFPTILSETLLQKSYQNFQIVPMMMDLITFRKFVETL